MSKCRLYITSLFIISSIFLACSCSSKSYDNKQKNATTQQKQSTKINFDVAGTTKKAAAKFLNDLQKNVKYNNKQGVANLTKFPLRINKAHHKTLFIKNKKSFISNYSKIITPIKSIILKQKLGNLFANYQGIMFGSGELWARANVKGEIKIIAINQTK